MRCSICSEDFDEEDGRLDSEGEFYCDECYAAHFSTCTYCERVVWMDDTFYDDGYVCDSCSDEHYFSCNCCDENTHNDTGHDTEDGRVCSSCYDNSYHTCRCGGTVHNEDWCYDCGTCEGCCTCADCEAVEEEEVPGPCTTVPSQPVDTYESVGLPVQERSRSMYDSPAVMNHSPISELEPIRVRVGGSSTGMPALIQRLDNSAFTLNDTNIKAVLGMLDKSKKLKVDDITGRHCTANDSYFQLTRIVAEIGKVKKPRHFYGVRSNECDIVLNHSTRDIIEKLTSLGLTYHIGTGDKAKVGLSFKVRKRKYDTCITFLKFLCTK